MQTKGVIHGDLRPENILVQVKDYKIGDIKLINCSQSVKLKDFEPNFQQYSCWNYQPVEYLENLLKITYPDYHKGLKNEYFKKDNLNPK